MFIKVYLFVELQMSNIRLASTFYFYYFFFIYYIFFITYLFIFLYLIYLVNCFFMYYTNLFLEISEYIVLNSVYTIHSNILLLRQSERNDNVNKSKPFNIKDILVMLPYCPCWYIPPWTINTYKCALFTIWRILLTVIQI